MCSDHPSPGPAVIPVDRFDPDGDPVTLTPVDAVRLTCLVDNVSDLLLPPTQQVGRFGLGAAQPAPAPVALFGGARPAEVPIAEHGYALLIELDDGPHTTTVLFDAGMTPGGLVHNLGALGRTPDEIDLVVLSHGHIDHTGGLVGLVDALGSVAPPMLVHPAAWWARRMVPPGLPPIELPALDPAALRDAGFELVDRREPSLLLAERLLVTGEISRYTAFEVGLANHEARGPRGWAADPAVPDDQAIVLHLRGRGLIVLTGCAHAGVVNTVHHAMQLTGVDAIDTVMGGFHLSGPAGAPQIAPTVDALAALGPALLVPTHCSGHVAQQRLEEALGEAVVRNSVGSRYHRTAAA
ncbi:MAG: MBL fold metallo-hydrolase [Nitriliruptor sp.]|nr:MAG: MBL fold metallo-hydrolase [Nitriliruptor sp.]